MAFRDGPLQDLKVPLTWTAALAAIVCGLAALAFLLTDSREAANGGAYGSARGQFDEVAQPVSGLFATPLRLLGGASTEVKGYFFAVAENRRLKARIRELERVRDDVVALRNVNARYEQLLQLRTEPQVPMISARVVTDVRGPFSNARLADAGRERGVKAGYPVLSDHGVVGRVVGVGRNVSRVLLLSDVDSRTPVLIDRTGARAILTGDGGGAPRMEYLRGVDPVKQGDVVLTSGDGGLYPRGLPVGVAAKDIRGGWRVRLYAEGQDVDYVRILAFDDFSRLGAMQLAELAAKAPPALPPADAAQLAAATAAKAAPPVPAFGGASAAAGLKPGQAPAGPPASTSNPPAKAAPAASPSAIPAAPNAAAVAMPPVTAKTQSATTAKTAAAKTPASKVAAPKPQPARTAPTTLRQTFDGATAAPASTRRPTTAELLGAVDTPDADPAPRRTPQKPPGR